MKILFRLCGIAGIIMLSVNCNNTKKNSGNKSDMNNLKSDVNLTETYWRLVELMGNPVTQTTSDKKEVYIKLRKDGNKIEGFGGCNGFGGEFTTRNNFNISITNIISTMIACPDLETENELFNILKTVDNYYIKSDTLSVSKAKMATMAKFVSVNFR